MLTYAEECFRMLGVWNEKPSLSLSFETSSRFGGKLTYADVCGLMLTYADVS